MEPRPKHDIHINRRGSVDVSNSENGFHTHISRSPGTKNIHISRHGEVTVLTTEAARSMSLVNQEDSYLLSKTRDRDCTLESQARFVTVCHMPRTLRVCIYEGVRVSDLEKLLASTFKTGNRRIVGFENRKTSTCVSLGAASFSPSILSQDLSYTLLFGDGEIEDKVMPYDFECSIPKLQAFVLSLQKRSILSEDQVRVILTMISNADRDVLLAYTFFRVDQDAQRFVATLAHLSRISDDDRIALLTKILAVNECVERAGLDAGVVPWVQRLILIGHAPTIEAFAPFEVSGDFAELRISLECVVKTGYDDNEGRENEDETHGDVRELFLEVVERLVDAGRVSCADAAWIRGRLAARDESVEDVARHVFVGEENDVSLENRVVALSRDLRARRRMDRADLDLLILDVPKEKISDHDRRRLLRLALEKHDVVLSAFEVYAFELDAAEFQETLLMLLETISDDPALDGEKFEGDVY
eukprot:g226.t1